MVDQAADHQRHIHLQALQHGFPPVPSENHIRAQR
jgi:hypothetical protein